MEPAARYNEEPCHNVVRRGYCTVPRVVHIPVTLRRFDDKLGPRSKTGPFIPSERRLADMEILGIQGHDL